MDPGKGPGYSGGDILRNVKSVGRLTRQPVGPLLRGGVMGGSLIEGRLKKGDSVEICPGIKVKGSYEPVRTTVTGMQKAMTDIPEAGPGGLLGVSTELDPFLAKSDTLAGNVLGIPGNMPPVHDRITMKVNLLERVVGAREDIRVGEIRTGDMLMLTTGTARTVGSVTSARPGSLEASLKIPLCTKSGDRIAISRQVEGRWRLIGWGELE